MHLCHHPANSIIPVLYQHKLIGLKQLRFFLREWRGLVVSTEDCHSKGRGIESRSLLFLLFVSKSEETFVTRRNVSVRKWPETKRVASVEAANWRGGTGRHFGNGYEKGFRFVSKTTFALVLSLRRGHTLSRSSSPKMGPLTLVQNLFNVVNAFISQQDIFTILFFKNN